MSTTELLMIPASAPVETGIKTGNTTTETGKKDGISFREAALRLGISEKTLRARIRSGEVEGWTVEGKRGLEWRVHLPVEDRDGDREPPGGDRDERHLARDQVRSLPVLQARLDGALLAARLHADRRRSVERERREDREELHRAAEEIAFLRAQLQQRTDAERELRLLLASTQQAIQALATRPALEPSPSATRTRWWNLFIRR